MINPEIVLKLNEMVCMQVIEESCHMKGIGKVDHTRNVCASVPLRSRPDRQKDGPRGREEEDRYNVSRNGSVIYGRADNDQRIQATGGKIQLQDRMGGANVGRKGKISKRDGRQDRGTRGRMGDSG